MVDDSLDKKCVSPISSSVETFQGAVRIRIADEVIKILADAVVGVVADKLT